VKSDSFTSHESPEWKKRRSILIGKVLRPPKLKVCVAEELDKLCNSLAVYAESGEEVTNL
jgi:hypothetical protein